MVANAIATGVVNLVLFGLLVAYCRLVHRDGRCSFLLHGDAGGRLLFLKGAMVGLASVAAYPVIVILLGQGRLDSNPEGMPATIACIASWGVGFLPVALFEEALFRGYLLPQALARFPQWVAVVIPSLLFGVFHSFSYGSGSTVWLGVLNAGLFGVAMSLIVVRSRSLMGTVGLHWAWNLAQETLLLQPHDGSEALFGLRVQESLWTGSPLRPEAGLIETVIIVLLGASATLWRGRVGPQAGANGQGLQGARGVRQVDGASTRSITR